MMKIIVQKITIIKIVTINNAIAHSYFFFKANSGDSGRRIVFGASIHGELGEENQNFS